MSKATKKYVPQYTNGVPEGFVTTPKDLRKTLNTYGVAIIQNVIDIATCEKTVQGLWDYLEAVSVKWTTPMKRDDVSTWKQYRELKVLHGMLMKHFGIGQAQFAWDLRQNEDICRIFMELLGVHSMEDLLVSMDSSSYSPDPNIIGEPTRGWFRGEHSFWLHADQSFLDSSHKCVQSWVTMYDVNKYDATLFIIPRSHLVHERLRNHFDLSLEENKNLSSPENWQKLTEQQLEFVKSQPECMPYGVVGITCPAGSMVFWDSRCIHCGSEPYNHPDRAPNHRLVTYLSFGRRADASAEELVKKRNAFKNKDTTAHWAGKEIRINPRKPRKYSEADVLQEMAELPYPVLTKLGLRLAGFDEVHRITSPLESARAPKSKSILSKLKNKLIK